MAMGQKGGLGVTLLVVAAVIAVGGFFAFKKAPSSSDINEATQASMGAANLDIEKKNTKGGIGADVIEVARKGETEAEKKAKVAPAANTEGEIQVEEGNPVVAIVDGKEITRVDVYRFIQTMPAQIQQLPAVQVYPMAMEQVINTRIVQNMADKADVVGTKDFKLEMEMAKQQIARNLYLEQEVDKKITEGKLKKMYNEQIKQIPDVEERRARHILLKTEDKAKAVLKKLETGEKFEDLAKSLSVGPTAPKGGDLGYFAKGEMVPEFSEAAFSLGKGAVSKAPVKTQFGWHVVKVIDVRQRQKPSFEMVEPMLRAEVRREALDGLLKDWRKGAKIQQFDINGKPLKKGANATGLVPSSAGAKPAGG